MLSYRNPTSMALSLENFRHGCCERDAATPCNPCDNAFRVCVRETPRMAVEGKCDLEMESELLEENDDELTFTIGEEVGGLNNPIRVSGEMWPVSIVNIVCFYWRSNLSGLASTLHFVNFLSPSLSGDAGGCVQCV